MHLQWSCQHCRWICVKDVFFSDTGRPALSRQTCSRQPSESDTVVSLMAYTARFGHAGATPGQVFEKRRHMYDAGLHSGLEKGISGKPDVGTDAIVLGGSPFDQD